uniref:FAD-dependent oxidoreductase n=1 Tax=Clostridium sp. 12(A) TaxID=1163671 RepID=UPI00046314FC|nr:FAD-dependent oxidoreductase [Clostridium sp. 12(A)]
MKEYEAQVGVIAAGPSGLAAAVQAAQLGASVVVLEKSAAVGGAANMGMGPLGIGTSYQKRQMIDISVEKAFNMFMDYTHYNVDARLVKRYFAQSGETIQWLEDMGVEFEGAFRYFPQSEATWHVVKTDTGIGPRAASFMNRAMYEKALELGVTILLEHSAKKIIKEHGKVTGIIGTAPDGQEVRVSCHAAIICTGGAGANKDMIKELTGLEHGKDVFHFAIPGLMGDGLRMAWEAGADQTQMRIEMASDLGGGEPTTGGVTNIMKQPNLLVNAFGKRVMNEDYMQNTTYLSNVANHQKNKVCFSIVDSSIVNYYVSHGVDVTSLVTPNSDVSDFYEGIEMLKKNGSRHYFVADTIEELAQKAGIDEANLKETIDNYNYFCDSRDLEFYKDPKYLRPLFKAPYYAAAIHPGGYGTVGGIRINENCEACDKEYQPVPGLYCAGADSCNIYDDSYMFLLPGNSMGYAVNTGRIAALSAVEYIRKEGKNGRVLCQ